MRELKNAQQEGEKQESGGIGDKKGDLEHVYAFEYVEEKCKAALFNLISCWKTQGESIQFTFLDR